MRQSWSSWLLTSSLWFFTSWHVYTIIFSLIASAKHSLSGTAFVTWIWHPWKSLSSQFVFLAFRNNCANISEHTGFKCCRESTTCEPMYNEPAVVADTNIGAACGCGLSRDHFASRTLPTILHTFICSFETQLRFFSGLELVTCNLLHRHLWLCRAATPVKQARSIKDFCGLSIHPPLYGNH